MLNGQEECIFVVNDKDSIKFWIYGIFRKYCKFERRVDKVFKVLKALRGLKDLKDSKDPKDLSSNCST